MNLAHFHSPKIIPIYTQGRSNKFKSLCDCFEAMNASTVGDKRGLGVWGHAPLGKFLKKSVQLGVFWQIFSLPEPLAMLSYCVRWMCVFVRRQQLLQMTPPPKLLAGF